MTKLHTPSKALRRMLVKVLDAVSPSLREIAAEVGVSYRAIRAYRLGLRTPNRRVFRSMVAVLRKQSAKIAKLADELEAASKRR